MFTLNQVKEAHQSTVKTGSDFPKYVQAIIQLGVARYETFVSDGHTVYYGMDDSMLQTEKKYPALALAVTANTASFKSFLQLHQQGKTDFMTFCKDCAATGVEKWVTDTLTMTCTYYDISGNEMLAEAIPVAQQDK